MTQPNASEPRLLDLEVRVTVQLPDEGLQVEVKYQFREHKVYVQVYDGPHQENLLKSVLLETPFDGWKLRTVLLKLSQALNLKPETFAPVERAILDLNGRSFQVDILSGVLQGKEDT